jgi:hypothetical protein
VIPASIRLSDGEYSYHDRCGKNMALTIARPISAVATGAARLCLNIDPFY